MVKGQNFKAKGTRQVWEKQVERLDSKNFHGKDIW